MSDGAHGEATAFEQLQYDDAPAAASGCAVVFGPCERPLAGRFHTARGDLLGSVLLCPPWGDEYVGAYQALRELAGRLATAGFDVLRIDVDGAGNSFGDDNDVGRLAAWTASVAHGLEFLGDRGAPAPAIVGLRLGATLAAIVAERRSVGPLVLWDPLLVGKRIVRTMKANSLIRGSEPAIDPGGVTVSGFDVTPATLRDLAAVQFDDDQYLPKTEAALVVVEAPTAGLRRFCQGIEQRGVPITVAEMPGAIQLVTEPAESAAIPTDILTRITAWMVEQATPPEQPPVVTSARPIMRDPAGVWTEHFLALGPQQITAVLTMPVRPSVDGGVLFPTIGKTRLTGPGRLWVTWSRELAANGVPSLRFDVSGLGDSGCSAGQVRGETYPAEAIDDVLEVASELQRIGVDRTVMVGVCSGATLAIDGGFNVPTIRGAVAVNGWHHHVAEAPRDPRRKRRARPPQIALVQAAANHRIGAAVLRRLPRWSWEILYRTHVLVRPTAGIERVARRMDRVAIGYWTGDAGWREMRSQGRHNVRRLTALDNLELFVSDLGDHSLHGRTMRTRVRLVIDEVVAAVLGSGPETRS